MTEQDKQTVAAAKEFGASDLTQDLVILVERLDKQLTYIGEAAFAFVELAKEAKQDTIEGVDINFVDNDGTNQIWALIESDYRRLAQALKGVKDE